MFKSTKTAQQQSIVECRSLSFAAWSILWLNIESQKHLARRLDWLTGKSEAAREIALVCTGQSALAHLIGNGSSGKPIPQELTLNILIKLAADLKADLWLKCTRPNGQFRQCLFIRSHTLHEQLAELLPADCCSRLVLVREDDHEADISFDCLFALAAAAGYRLTIKLLFDNQPVPGGGFYQRYPEMRRQYKRFIRERSATSSL